LRVHRPLPRRFFSYLRKHGEPGVGGGETIAHDVMILAETGEVLVEIDHFIMKRVGDSASTLKRATEAVETLAIQGAGRPEPASPESTSRPEAPTDAEGSSGILPQEGVEALRRVLSREFDVSQIAVAVKDLHALVARVSAITRSSIVDAVGAGAQIAVHARPNISTPYVAPSTESQQRLAAVWQATLGIEEVGVNDNFFDLGGDSILGIQVIARAGEAGLQLSPDQLFEHQTIAELAKVVGLAGSGPASSIDQVPLAEDEGAAAFASTEFPDADADLSQEELEKLFGKLEGVS